MSDFWLKLIKLIKPSLRQIKYLVFIILVSELLQFVAPYILKKIIDLITNFHKEEINLLILLLGSMLAANLIASFVDYLADRKIFKILAEVEFKLFANAQKKMVDLSLAYHEKENTGNKIIKIQRGIDKVIELLGNVFWEVGPTLVQVIFTAIILFFVDWRFGLIFLIFVPIFIKLTADLNKLIHPYRKKRHDLQEEAAGRMTETIININTVKSFVQEEREINDHIKIRELIKNNTLYEFFKMLNYNYGRSTVITLGRISILFYGSYLVWQGNITIGSLVFIITITEKALIALFRISRLYDRIMDSSEAVVRLYDLEREESDIVNPADGLRPKNIIGKIDFKDVSFAYHGSNFKALSKINLRINPSCITALVGPSGGGKTTVARMIYRHYDPVSGVITLDDKNLKDYDFYHFRKFIAIVPQEVEIFNDSVKKNIAYGKPGASQREIEAAARIANAEEFIAKLKYGYETKVGERGIKLSGGQRQRIGIARAVLANPRIIIFDEATSNLDSYSEKLIQQALEKICQGRTVIIIAHRLSTIKRADKIIVLEDGKVAEEGSHLELSRTDKGLYNKLLKLQQLGEIV